MIRIFLPLFFLVFFGQMGIAQLQRGDWMLKGNPLGFGITHQKSEVDTSQAIEGSIGFSAGKMVSDRLMIGSGISYYTHSSDYTIQSEGAFSNSSQTYGVSPFLRFYLNPEKRFNWFGFLNTYYYLVMLQWQAPQALESKSHSHSFNANAGFGVNYFFAPNLAFEGLLSANVFNTDNDYHFGAISKYGAELTIGVQMFLNDHSFEHDFDLESRYLHKGNLAVMWGGEFGLGFSESSVNGGLSFRPVGLKFFTDRFLAGGGVSPSFHVNDFVKSFGIGVSGTAKWYLPLRERLYFSPGLDASVRPGYLKTNTLEIIAPAPPDTLPVFQQVERERSTWHWNSNLELLVSYFGAQRSIFFGGMDLGLDGGPNFQHNYKGFYGQLKAGVTYFFAKNLAFTSALKYHTRKHEPADFPESRSKRTGFDVQIQYFIFAD